VDSLSVKRRLSCILAADAFGYSSQMGRDEEGTVRVLSAHRAVIDGIIAFHEGRIVNTAGDSVLAEFSSVVEAVRCAVEIQEAIKTRNDSLSEDHRMLFRVGINLGDVVVKDNNVLGDGVNVAARLESIAEPGGICISSSVYDQITGKLDLGFEDIGEQTLKNISRPIRVYRVSGTATMLRTAAHVRHVRKLVPWTIGAAGAASAVVIAAVVAWQTGWLRFGSIVASPATAVVAPAVLPQADPPAKNGSVAGTTGSPATGTTASPAAGTTAGTAASPAAGGGPAAGANAPRAQGELGTQRAFSVTQTQRVYSGTEALKRQAEADLARARANAAAGRGARTIVGGDAVAGRQRAQAELDSARIRTDAEAASAWRGNPIYQGPSNRSGR
jgi:class 3 adenylate cyclase